MDEESIGSSAAHPDVCRCCLSTKGMWDLTKSYDATDGDNGVKRQVQLLFSDMLQETYAITLAHLFEWDHSRLICDSCLGQLRNAYNFRKQVLKAEQFYVEYYNTKKEKSTSPDLKSELDVDSCDDGPKENEKSTSPDLKSESDVDSCDDGPKENEISTSPDLKSEPDVDSCDDGPKENEISTSEDLKSESDVDSCDNGPKENEISTSPELKSESDVDSFDKGLKDNEEKTFSIVKVETELNDDFPDSFHEDGGSPEENKNDLTIEPENKIEQPKTIKRRKKPVIVKSKRKKKFEEFDEFDSDTSLENRPKKNNKVKSKDKKIEHDSKASFDTPPAKSNIKESSYAKNNHLRKNMTLLLKNTSIVPFKSRHNTNGKYSCHYCDENYSPFEDLKKHVEDKHAHITEKEIMTSVKYPVDFVKAEVSEIRCKLCEKLFENLETVTEHLIGEHKKQYQQVNVKPTHGILSFILMSGQLKCHVCEMKFRHFRHLYTHTSEHCENFVCEMCGKNFLLYKSLMKHECKHSKQLLKCKFCEKSFKSPSGLGYHMRIKHNYGVLKCKKCNEVFKKKEEKADHLEKVHKIQKPSYYCELCSKAFASYLTFGRHMESIHWKEKKYICKTCGKSLASVVGLYIHTRTHTGERPYECKTCLKTFIYRSGYTRHLKIHR